MGFPLLFEGTSYTDRLLRPAREAGLLEQQDVAGLSEDNKFASDEKDRTHKVTEG